MGMQLDSKKHPCSYCGKLVGSGAYMHEQKHKRNGDIMSLQNGAKNSVESALKASYESTKSELGMVQDRLSQLLELREQETRLVHLLSTLEKALEEYKGMETKTNG